MEVNIYEAIRKELDRQDRSGAWLGKQIGSSTRNTNKMFERKDAKVSQLASISKALKKNFFKMYVPFIDAAIRNSAQEELMDDSISESKSTINISIKFPESSSDELGFFLKQVKLLAKEYGFEVE
jgi:hypothetical protein